MGLQCGVETVLVGHLVASVDTDLHGSVHHPLCHLGSHYLDHGHLLTGNLGGQQQKQPINLTPQSRYSLIERERERECEKERPTSTFTDVVHTLIYGSELYLHIYM